VVTNPPYGRQHKTPALVRLYRELAAEGARVLRPGGRFVVLTGEHAAFLRSLPRTLRAREKCRLLLRGLPVTAIVLERR
jgi:23S rRNA G2445 N2-methylase RlmL